jgi:hypothetical protein
MNATDNLAEADKLIKGIIEKRFSERVLNICQWLLSFNKQEVHFRIKCYPTGGNKPDVRFCIDRGMDCESAKIMTGFAVIEPNFEIMGLYSKNPDRYPYFSPDQKRWRIGSNTTSGLPDETIKKHIIESFCYKVEKLGVASVTCGKMDNTIAAHDTSKKFAGDSYLPRKDDFEVAYRSLTLPGQEVSIDAILDQIKINVIKAGVNLKEDWRIITERNIERWSSKK